MRLLHILLLVNVQPPRHVPKHVIQGVFRDSFPLVKDGSIEHVVPQSIAPVLRKDVHNMLWIPRSINCARGNKRLCVTTTRTTYAPPEQFRGMYARSVLFQRWFDGVLDEELALEWHRLHPPTFAERRAHLTLGMLQGRISHLMLTK